MSANLMAATSSLGQILYSGQIAATTATTLYTVPASTTVKLAQGTVCNTSASSVNVTLSVVPSGGSVDGTHKVLSTLPVAAGDTQPLKDFLGDVFLGPGDYVSITVGTGAVIDVMLSGVVFT